MTPKVICRQLFTDGVSQPIDEGERRQFVEDDGDRIHGVWQVPEENRADTPVIVEGCSSWSGWWARNWTAAPEVGFEDVVRPGPRPAEL